MRYRLTSRHRGKNDANQTDDGRLYKRSTKTKAKGALIGGSQLAAKKTLKTLQGQHDIAKGYARAGKAVQTSQSSMPEFSKRVGKFKSDAAKLDRISKATDDALMREIGKI